MAVHFFEMSHRILKLNTPQPRGLFNDISDMAESYWCWTKNKLTGSWTGSKEDSDDWRISDVRTGKMKGACNPEDVYDGSVC